MVGFGSISKLAQGTADSFSNKENEVQKAVSSDKSWSDVADGARKQFDGYQKGDGINAKEARQIVQDATDKYNTASDKEPAAIGKDAFRSLIGGCNKTKCDEAPGEPQQGKVDPEHSAGHSFDANATTQKEA